MKKRVVVAMSGGVDSSVSAYLLKEKGYQVVGASLKIWTDEKQQEFEKTSSCCLPEVLKDARIIAKKLKIPFYMFNLQKEFKKYVIDYFCREYLNGFTPNPCIKCNEKIKWGVLLEKAKKLGAGFIATGHYAKVDHDKKTQRYLLKKGKDKKKDQSYMLWPLNQNQLRHSIFPLGSYTKNEVRALAKDIGLSVHNKEESQDICFIPDRDYIKFLKNRTHKTRQGFIVDINGKILARHKGIHHFTVGQRKGLGAYGKPLYVISIDKDTNNVVVGENKNAYKHEFIIRDVNWIIEKDKPFQASVKIRYTHKEAPALVTPINENKARLKFREPQWAITPGQSAVFYNGDIVIGGGVIWETKKQNKK